MQQTGGVVEDLLDEGDDDVEGAADAAALGSGGADGEGGVGAMQGLDWAEMRRRRVRSGAGSDVAGDGGDDFDDGSAVAGSGVGGGGGGGGGGSEGDGRRSGAASGADAPLGDRAGKPRKRVVVAKDGSVMKL
jgi:hypothetical protein